MNDSIINAYTTERPRFDRFAEKLVTLLGELCASDQIKPQSITGRVKKRCSLERKLFEKPDHYQALADITDTVGARIIVHSIDEIEQVSALVRKEFLIDEENSLDKATLLDPERFGYLSVHIIAQIDGTRTRLSEYSEFKELKAEIQIRSLLQHAWAEIEHKIGYHSSRDVPRQTRRQFARLAGMLEIADEEFAKLRAEDKAYSDYVNATLDSNPELVEIDLVSLGAFIATSSEVASLNTELAQILPLEFRDPTTNDLSQLVDNLRYLNISTIQELTDFLTSRRDIVIKRASFEITAYGDLATAKTRPVHQGISVAYLCQMVAATDNDLDETVRFLEIHQLFGTSTNRRQFAQFLHQALEHQL